MAAYQRYKQEKLESSFEEKIFNFLNTPIFKIKIDKSSW